CEATLKDLCIHRSRSSGGETKRSFGGVGLFGFNKQSSGHDISQPVLSEIHNTFLTRIIQVLSSS
ncbi:hypothetical protein, partial [Nostoc sp. PCC 9305]|uniref:hypothetical protein n=1 Tax=Nostoc sp. PCC 9305 TaxID=296636 RepID=UPI0039C602FC